MITLKNEKLKLKLIIGDMNLERRNIYKNTIEKHSLHYMETNKNEEMLIDFATSRNMVITSTIFPHRDIHKGTWLAPDGKTINQIDSAMINRRAATSTMDVKTRRGAIIGSDHFPVQNLDIKNNKKRKEPNTETRKIQHQKRTEIAEK